MGPAAHILTEKNDITITSPSGFQALLDIDIGVPVSAVTSTKIALKPMPL